MNIKIKKYVIQDEKIPKELSGYRIALFSDCHNKYFGENGAMLIDKIDEINPDCVLFAGDGNNTVHSAVDPNKGYDNFEKLFLSLSKKYTTYYVNGNHEHRWIKLCEELSCDDFERVMNNLKESGIIFLNNISALIAGDQICIYGLDLHKDYYKHEYTELTVDIMNEMIGRPRPDCYNILLTHTPIFFPVFAEWGADLTVCGHLHGGMIRLPIVGGMLSPYRKFFPKYDYGSFTINDKRMIITSGAGDHNIRFTPVNPYEIAEITLESKE